MALPGPMAVAPPTHQTLELTADSKEARRMSTDPNTHPGYGERQWGFAARLAPEVTFEEFTHWAKVERELEEIEFRRYKSLTTGGGFLGSIKGYFTTDPYAAAKRGNHDPSALATPIGDNGSHENEKEAKVMDNSRDISPEAIGPNHTSDLDAEWRQASRALRTAGWGAIFYLITTDILGFSQTPYVFSCTGYGLGVGIFLLMGIAAGVSGIMIWRTFLGLDSSRFPMVTFGDAFFRLFGPKTRHFINVLQSLQMFLSVAVVLLGQTFLLAQLAAPSDLCLMVCAVIVLLVSMASGYMRALKHIGWFANASVWINFISFIIICVAAAKYGPDPTAQVQTGVLNKAWKDHPAPVKTFTGTPPAMYQPTTHNLFAAKFNGINSMVYAYSGAILFIAFLSEMRHPMDFWKAMLCAQTFISVIYIFFGAFVYKYYGQYAYTSVQQTVRPLSLQIVNNVLGLITGWLAIFLYFNVGMKTVYVEVGQEVFHLPAITTKKGKYLWWGLGPLYWILAFIIALSVPQFGTFTNFIGGLFSLNFTYSFSGIMYAAYNIQEGARLPGEGFDPATGVTTRHDNGMKRWVRGFTKSWMISLPVIIFSLAGLAASGMGSWAGINGLKAAFAVGGSVTASWTCTNPFA